MDESELKRYLKEKGVWYRFIAKSETVHTIDAAKAVGVELNRVTKNLVAKTEDGEYVILIVPGDRKVDLEEAAKVLSTRNVQLVSFDEAEDISGYPPGGTPSVGHKTKMKAVVDISLLLYETVYCGGGSRSALLELRIEEVIKLNDAIVADISKFK